MKILVYGAGVLGSLFAARLKESGHDVTVLARGKRFDEIEAQGIVLEHALKGTRGVTPVAVTRDLKPDDCYDLVLVVMRRNQVADVLPALAASRKSELVVFVVCTWRAEAGRRWPAVLTWCVSRSAPSGKALRCCER